MLECERLNWGEHGAQCPCPLYLGLILIQNLVHGQICPSVHNLAHNWHGPVSRIKNLLLMTVSRDVIE